MECNVCHRLLRWDEEQRPVMIEGVGNTFCCPDCQARALGLPPPETRRYPAGTRIPRHPWCNTQGTMFRDCDLPICGLCRRALPWGVEKGTNLKIRPEMIRGEEVEPGGYCACDECMAYWKPRLLEWLKRMCRECHTLDCEETGHTRIMVFGAELRQVQGGLLA